MDNDLSCDIVRDLLPSYVDGLTGETTNRAIEGHMSGCPDCAEALRRMREPEPVEQSPAAEVDYLKKLRRGTAKVGMVCGIVMMLIGMFIILFRVFFVGTEADASDVYCSVSVSDNTVYLNGTLTSSALGVARVQFEDSAGMVRARIYTAPKTFFNSGDFSSQYETPAAVGMVRIGDIPLWYEGTSISPVAGKLYAAANPFVGDMPANSRLASILGISDQLGTYASELQTDAEPYGWALLLDEPIAADDEEISKEIMNSDSCVLLALVDNLGYVEWRYTVSGKEVSYTVAAEDASGRADKDIKLCGETPAALQSLLDKLNTKWSGMPDVGQESGSFRLKISDYCDDKIYGFTVYYYLDGKPVGSSGMQAAGKAALNKGDEVFFQLTPQDFPAGTTAADLSAFSFDLYATDSDGNDIPVELGIKVSAKYAWTFFYSLSGDFENGFVLNEG